MTRDEIHSIYEEKHRVLKEERDAALKAIRLKEMRARQPDLRAQIETVKDLDQKVRSLSSVCSWLPREGLETAGRGLGIALDRLRRELQELDATLASAEGLK